MKTRRLTGILGLTRVRNEAVIIQDTLDHFARFCDEGIIVLDDASTDATPDLAASHPAVKQVLHENAWSPHRPFLEGVHRQKLLSRGKAYEPLWFLYFDADERIEWDFRLPKRGDYDAVAMKLWDAYITEDDKDEIGCKRKWFGPEWREIVFLFKNLPRMWYVRPDSPRSGYDRRNVAGYQNAYKGGFVKHFGKAVSVKEWEETCVYYQLPCWGPLYNIKWRNRMGQAVHTRSDFGRPLVTWDQAKDMRHCKELMLHGLPGDQ